jgi:glycosyltransferase involved in cell wall biosynthesis
MSTPDVSVIITTYNTPRFLEFCLLGYGRQTAPDFELVVADDGSTGETREVIERFSNDTGREIKHVWQEDRGYRKCHILNKGIRASTGRYLVFADGDCVPHSKFVEDHLAGRRDKTAVTSRRVKWGKRFTEGLTRQYIASGAYESFDLRLISSFLLFDTKRLTRGVRITNPPLSRLLNLHSKLLSGCSFSIDREGIEAINGFDEEYEGPGFGPDRDVHMRLETLGYRVGSLMYKALQYHMYHPEVRRPPQNRERYERLLQERWVQCRKGLRVLA